MGDHGEVLGGAGGLFEGPGWGLGDSGEFGGPGGVHEGPEGFREILWRVWEVYGSLKGAQGNLVNPEGTVGVLRGASGR